MENDYKTPGQLIQGNLTKNGWTQKVLAIVTGIDKGIISKIASDKRPVDAEIALLLGEVFNISPKDILDLQTEYDLAKARISARPDPKRTDLA